MVHRFFQGANLQLSAVETMLSLEKVMVGLKGLRVNEINNDFGFAIDDLRFPSGSILTAKLPTANGSTCFIHPYAPLLTANCILLTSNFFQHDLILTSFIQYDRPFCRIKIHIQD